MKSEEQQVILSIHRIRGLLEEFGMATPKGRYPGQHAIQSILEETENGLADMVRELIEGHWKSVRVLNQDILRYDRRLYRLANHSNTAKRIMTMPGIGELSAMAKGRRQLRVNRFVRCHAPQSTSEAIMP